MGKIVEVDVLKELIRFFYYISKLIDFFLRKDIILIIYDIRLIKVREFFDYFQRWKDNVSFLKEFLLDQLWFDLRFMIIGLQKVVEIKMIYFKDVGIKFVIIN